MNCHTLGATWAQHRNDVDYSNPIHSLCSSVSSETLALEPHASHERLRSKSLRLQGIQTHKQALETDVHRAFGFGIPAATMRAETVVKFWQNRGRDSALHRFAATLPHCAINRPKKNHVGFRISQVKLDTPTIQTPMHTIQSFRGKAGKALIESNRTPSRVQKSARPTTPCSTRTDRKVLCAGGAAGRAY